ncbi:MAG: VIT1/CCC1 transporter family protein [Actinomycetota bacterium]
MSVQHEHHREDHRNLQGGAARAAVFGVSDGLVSNVSLILGMAGADSSQGLVRVAGLAGLVAGAVSMAAGEYVSMQAQRELLERELAIERRELRVHPQREIAELTEIYTSRGVDEHVAAQMARGVMADPEQALEAHAREEMGVDPSELGNPVGAAVTSFLAFAVGALLPLLPWFFGGGTAAVIASVVLGLLGALGVGLAVGVATGRSRTRAAVRQVAIAAAAAAITYGIGSAGGAEVG